MLPPVERCSLAGEYASEPMEDVKYSSSDFRASSAMRKEQVIDQTALESNETAIFEDEVTVLYRQSHIHIANQNTVAFSPYTTIKSYA